MGEPKKTGSEEADGGVLLSLESRKPPPDRADWPTTARHTEAGAMGEPE